MIGRKTANDQSTESSDNQMFYDEYFMMYTYTLESAS